MRLALLSDIHANAPALRAALDAIATHAVDRTIVAGDIVGGGPFPSQTVQLLMAEKSLDVIRGNIDRKMIRLFKKKRKSLERRSGKGGNKARNRAWTALALGEDERAWLSRLPAQLALPVEGFEILVVHGSPLGDEDYIYPSLTEEALERKLRPLAEPKPDLLVCGHSHIAFAREVGRTFVTNCGSVGRQVDGDPRGSFAIAELTRGNRIRVDLFRFGYPTDELAKAIEAEPIPDVRLESYLEGVDI